MTKKEALKLRSIVEQATASLDDKTASEGATLYPRMKYNGDLIEAGVRINWNGTIKKAAAPLWDTEDNNPNNAPALWEDIQYRDGHRIIPQSITAASAFAQGEKGWWYDMLYMSIYDGDNVWTPSEYPQGWAVAQ